VGYAAQKDTAKVNALLNTPEVRAAIPHNAKLFWDVKSNGDAKVFRYMRSNYRVPKRPDLSGCNI